MSRAHSLRGRPGAAPPAKRGTVRTVALARFDAVERLAHWANALLFGILVATALPLYFASVESVVGRRALVAEIHVWAGVALPVPLCVSLAGPWGARFRHDVRRLNRWSSDELRWLRSVGTRALPSRRADKFNPGQKLNAAFTAGAIVVMLASGSVLKWFALFPLSWRTGATFVHDVLATVVVVVVAGHVLLALTHPQSLRSMVTGTVSEDWARRHAGGWAAEELGDAGSDTPERIVGEPGPYGELT
ncbi:MAG: cytochrome b/b6 domain-containing protein [Acidimicrobiales bacterium]